MNFINIKCTYFYLKLTKLINIERCLKIITRAVVHENQLN